MRRLHIGINVADITTSVKDYSTRLGHQPVLVIENEYALWRMPHLNLSIRKSRQDNAVGIIRHLGWEDGDAEEFTVDIDVNGIFWETFSAEQQADEVRKVWPHIKYEPE